MSLMGVEWSEVKCGVWSVDRREWLWVASASATLRARG